VNEHNAVVPRDFWIEPEERAVIIAFDERNPLEGYRRLTFMMLDQDVVAVSPSTVYRVPPWRDRAKSRLREEMRNARTIPGCEDVPDPDAV